MSRGHVFFQKLAQLAPADGHLHHPAAIDHCGDGWCLHLGIRRRHEAKNRDAGVGGFDFFNRQGASRPRMPRLISTAHKLSSSTRVSPTSTSGLKKTWHALPKAPRNDSTSFRSSAITRMVGVLEDIIMADLRDFSLSRFKIARQALSRTKSNDFLKN